MIPFVGPSYSLTTRKADVQRSINLMLKQTESGTGKAALNFYLESIPGLTLFASPGSAVRGGIYADGRCFVVAGSTLYEVSSAGVCTSRGTLLSNSGVVDLAYGLDQVVIVDGPYGYVLTLATNVFARITSAAFYGSDRVFYLDGYFVFNRPGTQQFYISAIDDASTLDALDFASAEGAPDDLISLVSAHRELWLFGETTTEVWYNTGAVDFPFARNSGAFLEIGCAAKHSAQRLDNSVIWIGRDTQGAGQVFRAVGYVPQRISNFAIEEALATSTDLSGAIAFTYQQNGQSFYCLQAPGLSTTLVFEATSGQWHERADLVSGAISQHRGRVHVFAFDKHLLGADDGNLYELDPDVYVNGSDVLYRERTSPHYAKPGLVRAFFDRFKADVVVGVTGSGVSPLVELCWSDDGGYTWSAWLSRSLGQIGEYGTRVEWSKLGSARDRVWKLRCTSNAKFSIVGAEIQAR